MGLRDIESGHIYLDPLLKALLGFEESEIPNEIASMGQSCTSR